jgi:hypothetical protein
MLALNSSTADYCAITTILPLPTLLRHATTWTTTHTVQSQAQAAKRPEIVRQEKDKLGSALVKRGQFTADTVLSTVVFILSFLHRSFLFVIPSHYTWARAFYVGTNSCFAAGQSCTLTLLAARHSEKISTSHPSIFLHPCLQNTTVRLHSPSMSVSAA